LGCFGWCGAVDPADQRRRRIRPPVHADDATARQQRRAAQRDCWQPRDDGITALIGTPTGILAGTFLAEYARGSRLGEVVQFVNDAQPLDHHQPVRLRSMVVRMGNFSAWAGAVALAIIDPGRCAVHQDVLRLAKRVARSRHSPRRTKMEGDRDGHLPPLRRA
jgi:hypothetical protein